MNNAKKFEETLARHYARLFELDPGFTYAKTRTTPVALAAKMTAGLAEGTANHDGDGIRAACRELGIRTTATAIREYLKA